MNNDIYEYDPLADSWTRKADFPGVPRFGTNIGFSSVYNGYPGYIAISTSGAGNDFWEYDPYAASSPQSGLWSDNGSWANNTVPPASGDARVSTEGGDMITVATSTAINDLAIDEGAILNINSGTTLTVTGDLNVEGTIEGDGSIILSGSSEQLVSATGEVNNVTVNNASDVTLAATDLRVDNVLTFLQGKINTGTKAVVGERHPAAQQHPQHRQCFGDLLPLQSL